MQNQNNMRIIELLRFLYSKTDENHPATVTDIIFALREQGIHAVRQTIYTDLSSLMHVGFDIVVIKGSINQYFLGDRIFEYPELKILADAVASSKIISAKKTEVLLHKLGCLTSIYQAEQLKRLASLSSRVKPNNEKIYYIIDRTHSAILDHRQIAFQYYEYTQRKEKILKHNGYRYVLDPYALEWKNDHYYLIGFSHKHQGIAHFRVDRITSVEILKTAFIPVENFDVAAYTNTMVEMFATRKPTSVELLCENRLMRTIIDHYGEQVPVRFPDREHFIATIEVNPSGTFYGWVFKFMGAIKILSPEECVYEMKMAAELFL